MANDLGTLSAERVLQEIQASDPGLELFCFCEDVLFGSFVGLAKL